MKVDMSPHAITVRLKQTSDLRRLCVALGGNRLKANTQIQLDRGTAVVNQKSEDEDVTYEM
jgi:hypothetical protein